MVNLLGEEDALLFCLLILGGVVEVFIIGLETQKGEDSLLA